VREAKKLAQKRCLRKVETDTRQQKQREDRGGRGHREREREREREKEIARSEKEIVNYGWTNKRLVANLTQLQNLTHPFVRWDPPFFFLLMRWIGGREFRQMANFFSNWPKFNFF
jgi:hypothetical protein